MMSNSYENGFHPKPTSFISGGYKEENRNVGIEKTESMSNHQNNGNSEFDNKRIPMEAETPRRAQQKSAGHFQDCSK